MGSFRTLVILFLVSSIWLGCTTREPFPLDWQPREVDFSQMQIDQSIRLTIQAVGSEDVLITDIAAFANGVRIDPRTGWLGFASGENIPFNLIPGHYSTDGYTSQFSLDYEGIPEGVDTAEVIISYEINGRPEGTVKIPVGIPNVRTERPLTQNPKGTQSFPIKFSSSGNAILYNSNIRLEGNQRRFDGYMMSLTGQDIRMVTESPNDEDAYAVDINSAETLILYYRDSPNGARNIFIKDINSGDVRQITSNSFINTPVGFNQNGTTVLYNSNRSGSFDVYTFTLDGQTIQITSTELNEFAVGWGANRDDILLYAEENGVKQIYLSTNGTNPIYLSRNLNNNDVPVQLAGNNNILFYSERSNLREVWKMTTNGTSSKITNNNTYDFPVRYFPDGSKVLYYGIDFAGNMNVYVIEDVEGAIPTRVTGLANSSQIPVDIHPNQNTVLYYSERRFQTVDIFTININ